MLYKNAPIQEAVLDIQVSSVSNTEVETYKELPNRLADFPLFEKYVNINQVEVDTASEQVNSKSFIRGVIFSNKPGIRKIQFRSDGFSVNFLKPYSNWNELLEMSFKYWEIYQKEIKPAAITRIALRYINQIELPEKDGLDFDHYFNYVPKIPSNLPQFLNSLFVQMSVPCRGIDEVDGLGPIANITQSFSYVQQKLRFLLDIDVFKHSIVMKNFDFVSEFNELRRIKNEIFENSITDKTRELFQ